MTPTFLLLAAVAIVNIAVSVRVLRVPELSPGQRFLQLGLVWLIPVFGAVVCAAFVRSQAGAGSTEGKIDPLYHPGDGGGPDGPDVAGICGCGGDSGGDGGGD